jgi:hypothetical protein
MASGYETGTQEDLKVKKYPGLDIGVEKVTTQVKH